MAPSLKQFSHEHKASSNLSSTASVLKPRALDQHAIELATFAKEGKLLGIGSCGINPSGCFDIAKGMGGEITI